MNRRSFHLAVALALALAAPRAVRAFDVVISTQGEFADAYLVNGTAFPPKVVFDAPDPANPASITGTAPHGGRHLNGKLCFIPRRSGARPNRYVVADDTYRESCLDTNSPQARCTVTSRGNPFFIGKDPDGWAVLKLNGRWAKRHIHTAWPGFDTTPLGMDPGQPPQGNADPQGCVFDAQGNMYGNDVGSGDPTDMDPSHHGALEVFFPGPRHRYDTYCFLDKNLAQAGMPAMDESGNIYIAETGMGMMWKYSPPFPASEADCPGADHLVTTPPTKNMFSSHGTVPCPLPRPTGPRRCRSSDDGGGQLERRAGGRHPVRRLRGLGERGRRRRPLASPDVGAIAARCEPDRWAELPHRTGPGSPTLVAPTAVLSCCARSHNSTRL